MAKEFEGAAALALIVVGFIAAVFLMPLIGTLLGAFSGWVVGLFFAETIMTTLAGFGFGASISMWQLGASLGFVGGFFRVRQFNKVKK